METNRTVWEENFFMTVKLMLGCLAIGGILLLVTDLQQMAHFLKEVVHLGLTTLIAFLAFFLPPFSLWKERVKNEIKEKNSSVTLVAILVFAFVMTIITRGSDLWKLKSIAEGNILVVVAFFFFFCATLLCALMWKIHTTPRVFIPIPRFSIVV
jgi:hypothetical protein